MKTLFVTTLIALSLLSGSLHAQASQPVDARLRILIHQHQPAIVIPPGEEIPPEYQNRPASLYYYSPDGYQPLSLSRNNITQPIDYRGPQQFTLYERIPATTPDGEDQYRPRMVATLPAGTGEYFLIGHREQREGNLPRLIPVPVNPADIPRGRILGMNLSNLPLQVATENQRISIAPFRTALIDISATQPMRFQILAAIEDEGEYKLVYRRMWPVRPSSRGITLFFPTNDAMTRWNSEMLYLD